MDLEIPKIPNHSHFNDFFFSKLLRKRNKIKAFL